MTYSHAIVYGKLLSECNRILMVNAKTTLLSKANTKLKACKRLASNSTADVPHYISSDNLSAVSAAIQNMIVHEDFITEEEEELMLKELEPYMKRLRYESSHWDDAIHGYRETEKANWNKENRTIIDRVRNLAFTREDKQLKHVHVLDISAEGYIKPHVDSIKFCGDTITGISLLSSSVMRLVDADTKQQKFDILLKRRSLYIMKGDARYHYTHEILPDNLSHFKSIHIPRQRRISVICRNAPPLEAGI